MKSLKEDFVDILSKQRIKPVFQPIVSLKNGKIIGYEALSRVIDPKDIQCSEELFYLAGIYGKVWELEQLCRTKILEKYSEFSDKGYGKLFLNVNPMVIHDKGFRSGFTSEYLQRYSVDIQSIVFEVTERNAVDDIKGFKDTVRHYKEQGYNIAVNDAGSCYSGLNLICDVVPHYLKLDIALIRDINKDAVKYAMVKAMVEFANLTNIELIAEGIECEDELKALLKLGVHNAQGYFLRRPDSELKEIDKNALEVIQKYNSKNVKRVNAETNEYRVVLFKLDSVKAYNKYCEKYGDENADKIIELMHSIVEQNLSENENVVYLGLDGTVAVLNKKDYKIKCELIADVFRKRLQGYYYSDEWEQGYIEWTNKRGEQKKYPIIEICSERIV